MVIVIDVFGCVSFVNVIVIVFVVFDVEIIGVVLFCECDFIFLNVGDYISY